VNEKEVNSEIGRAVSGCRNDADPENLYPNWRELFAKHNLDVLSTVGGCEIPDGITWIASVVTDKPLPIIYPAIVQYRDDGSYLVKCSGLLRGK